MNSFFSVIFRFEVVSVSYLIASNFLLRITTRNIYRIRSNLIHGTRGCPGGVYRLVIRVIFFSFLRKLITVLTYRSTNRFTRFFNRCHRVNRFTRVTRSMFLCPKVRLFLYFFWHRCSLFFMSVRVIAKPSFVDSAFVSTPGSPMPVSLPGTGLDSQRGYSCDKASVSNHTTHV